MEIVLLFISLPAYVVHEPIVHLPIMLLHFIGGVIIGLRLMDRMPLTALFVGIYVLMFFTNPLAVMSGLIDLEYSSTWNTFYRANAMMMTGMDLFLLAAIRFRTRGLTDFQNHPRVYLKNGVVEMTIWGGIIASFVSLAAIVVGGKALGVDVFTIHKTYRTTGGQEMAFLITTYVTSIIPLIVFLIAQRKIGMQVFYFSALLTVLVVYFLIFRNRTLPIACAIAYVIGLVARFRYVSIGGSWTPGRLPKALAITVIAAGPLLFTTGMALRYVRGAWQLQDFSFNKEILQREIDHALYTGELGYAYMTREAIRLFPSRNPYLYGQTYYRLLFAPIPRSLWPGKPENTNRLFADIRDRELGRKGVTQSAGIVGTLYINFGQIGVLGMFPIGLIFSRERYAKLQHLLALSGTGLWLVAIVRGSDTAPIMTLLFVYLIALLFVYFAKPGYAARYQPQPYYAPQAA